MITTDAAFAARALYAGAIAPGYACPANDFLAASLRATGDEFLFITSASRSRHAMGADYSPAHWRMDGLRAEFADEPGVLIVEDPDEASALSRYPRFQPMSPTILGSTASSRWPAIADRT